MKRIIVPFAAILSLAFAVPAFAEWELGASWTPVFPQPTEGQPPSAESIVGFHAAFNWWHIAYASWDSLALPNFMISRLTEGGFNSPGFLNLFDVGVRFSIRPIVFSAEVGVNNLWVYKMGFEPTTAFGPNLRLAAGLKFGWWGVSATATQVFSSWDEMGEVLGGLWSDSTRDRSFARIADGLIWSVMLTFYIG